MRSRGPNTRRLRDLDLDVKPESSYRESPTRDETLLSITWIVGGVRILALSEGGTQKDDAIWRQVSDGSRVRSR